MERLMFVPLEILPERYTGQWYDWFMTCFSAFGFSPIVVGDTEVRQIKVGEFLDVYQTNQYKINQLSQIIQHIIDGFEGTIFFMDLWFPGIEAIAYIRDCTGRKIRIEGIWHAGTYDPNDFLARSGCGKWGASLESSWVQLVDKGYVATKYHKTLLENARGAANLEVVQFPCYQPNYNKRCGVREDRVVFPHRLAPEKQPELFVELEKLYKEKYGNDIEFVRTKDVCSTKDDYYGLLLSSKCVFSSALQETFGIAMIEGLNCGCIPVAPNRLSYCETFDSKYLYNDLKEAVEMVRWAVKTYELPPCSKYNESVSDIVRRIRV